MALAEEPIKKRSDVEKIIRTVALDRVAHFGMMLEKVNRQNRQVERIGKFAATGKVEDLSAPAAEEGEDMGVNIGNEYHFHDGSTQQAPAPAPVQESAEEIALKILAKLKKQRMAEKAQQAPVNVTQTVTSPQDSPMKKWLLPAVLAGGIASGGLGSYLINYLSQPAEVVDTDTDTYTDVVFPK